MRRQLRGSRAIVTGASSGIGRALAIELARRGVHVLLNARREDRLQVLAGEITSPESRAVIVAGDITDPETRRRIVSTAAQQFGGVDLLVNNAGIGGLGPFADAAPDRLRRIMEVNFFAPCELIRECLPLLRAGRRSMIVNIASILGHRAVPNKSEYCASKFALHGISDALRCELAGFGVDVLVVNPSTTQSEFFEHVAEQDQRARPSRRGMSAERVARCTVRAIEKGKHELILSWGGTALVWLDRLFPTLADNLVERFGS